MRTYALRRLLLFVPTLAGFSYSQRQPVSEILAERFPRSMELAVLTLALAVAWSIPLGVALTSYDGITFMKVWLAP